MTVTVDLAEAQPAYLRRIPPKETTMPTPDPNPATPAQRQKKRDCLNVIVKVQIPVTDRASTQAAYEASDDAKAASSWPEGSIVTVTNALGKMAGP